MPKCPACGHQIDYLICTQTVYHEEQVRLEESKTVKHEEKIVFICPNCKTALEIRDPLEFLRGD